MVKSFAAALAAVLLTTYVGFAQETVLYDFWSPTCGPCRQMEPTVARLISSGYQVRRINLQGQANEKELARHFRVTRVPCFVAVVAGQEVDRVVGATSFARLEQMVLRAARPARVPESAPASTPLPAAPSQQSPWSSPASGNLRESQNWPAGSPTTGTQPASFHPSEPTIPTPRNTYTAEDSASVERCNRDLVSCSVRLRIEDEAGHSWGTGTIIDARSGEALIVTCGHVFRDSKARGSITVELFDAAAGGPKVVERVAGQIINYDLERDIGLVSIRPSRPVRVAAVAATVESVQPHDRVTSIGCNHGANPTAVNTHVTAIDRYLGPPNIEAAGAPVEGRSGGGLFNQRGELIGVCYAADPEGDEGLYVGLASIHAELDRIGLSEIYEKNVGWAEQESMAADTAAVRIGQNPSPTNAVAQLGGEPNPTSHPQSGISASPSATPPTSLTATSSEHNLHESAVPETLSPLELAAWNEIMERAQSAEVICIVRPKTPDARSEVITLSDVSPEFVRRLAKIGAAEPSRP